MTEKNGNFFFLKNATTEIISKEEEEEKEIMSLIAKSFASHAHQKCPRGYTPNTTDIAEQTSENEPKYCCNVF